MIFAILLAGLSILSDKINTFMTIPSWMPDFVTQYTTFGSVDRVSGYNLTSGRIWEQTLAAVESIFDAYYERVYYKSAAGSSDQNWRISDYGPREFQQMAFTNHEHTAGTIFNYRGGDRTVPNTTRLVEFPEVTKLSSWYHEGSELYGKMYLARLLSSDDIMLERNNWCEGSVGRVNSWSSSLIERGRLPASYDWRSQPPSGYDFTACTPVWACGDDSNFIDDTESRKDYPEKYPIPRMFQDADAGYYEYVIAQRLLGQSFGLSYHFDELINTNYGGNAYRGITDMSCRLKPDDYIDSGSNQCSSLLATLSRTFATIDRTYENVIMNAPYVAFTNDTTSCSKDLYLSYAGTLRNIDFELDQSEFGHGTFTCSTLTDENLSLSSSSITTNTTTSVGVIGDATRDRGRFSGTSTSVTQSEWAEPFSVEN